MPSDQSANGSQIKSVARALTVIEALSAHREGAELTALARELSLPKGSVYRVLRTLLDFGYVRQDPVTERYALGVRFLHIAASVEHGTDVRALARPALVRLSEQTAETVHLAVPENDHMVYIDKVESRRAVVMASRVGQQLPLHCSALGKAYLSVLAPDERRAVAARLPLERRTARTLVDLDALLEDLEHCVERGFAIDDLENEDGLRCVGAAIVDSRGSAVAALSVSAPASRFSLPAARKVGRLCAQLADEVSEALGAPAA
ncbi:MAG TPA: IclR family transcriptional regulator [Capillimicrobium sp.]|jgi:IclR family acetate operon transcriptional repressor